MLSRGEIVTCVPGFGLALSPSKTTSDATHAGSRTPASSSLSPMSTVSSPSPNFESSVVTPLTSDVAEVASCNGLSPVGVSVVRVSSSGGRTATAECPCKTPVISMVGDFPYFDNAACSCSTGSASVGSEAGCHAPLGSVCRSVLKVKATDDSPISIVRPLASAAPASVEAPCEGVCSWCEVESMTRLGVTSNVCLCEF